MAELAIHCADGLSLEGLIKLAIRNADCEDYLTCDNKNESLESLLKRAFSIGDDGTYALNVCGCGGGDVAGLTSVTYAELVALIGSSGLTAGSFYLLTDFATVHYFTDTEVVIPGQINTGTTESLILFSTSNNSIDSRVYSPSYPQDIIHYDWDSANWLLDSSFTDDGVNIVTGWKGIITFRHDTALDNYTGYDFRNVKFRRWALIPNNWAVGTTYAAQAIVQDVDIIYISLQGSNTGKTPATEPAWWTPIVDISTTKYKSWSSTQGKIIKDANDYLDFYTFNFSNYVRMNHIEPITDDSDNYYFISTRLNNIVFLGVADCNHFTAVNSEMTIEDNASYNIFSGYNYGSIIERSAISNTVSGQITNSIIYKNFKFNDVAGLINGTVIGQDCQYNSFRSNIDGNYISKSFQKNTFGCNTSLTDFLLATHVYGTYNCSIQSRQDGTAVLTYIDNSNVQQIVAATA